MGVASDYEANASFILEHLLTEHPCRREIALLPDEQIQRLRGMIYEAVEQRLTPQEVYDAITRGFDPVFGISAASPPLANDLIEDASHRAVEALLRELSAA